MCCVFFFSGRGAVFIYFWFFCVQKQMQRPLQSLKVHQSDLSFLSMEVLSVQYPLNCRQPVVTVPKHQICFLFPPRTLVLNVDAVVTGVTPFHFFLTLVVLTAVFHIHLFSIESMCQEPKQKGHEKSGWHAMTLFCHPQLLTMEMQKIAISFFNKLK